MFQGRRVRVVAAAGMGLDNVLALPRGEERGALGSLITLGFADDAGVGV